jgi:hypothetical protein
VRRLVTSSAVAAVLALGLAGAAGADGDPASDTLVYQNVFFPYPAPSRDTQRALTTEVAGVYREGYRLKVAVVAAPSDLGAIPSLFNKPAGYANFLGQEISSLYVGPLVIVMPAGYGVYDGGRSTRAEDGVLTALPAPGTKRPDDLTRAATSAVSRLLYARALRSKDILAPEVSAVSGVLNGGVLEAVYYISDDSGRAAARLSILSSGRVVFAVRLPMRPTKITKPVQTEARVATRVAAKRARVCVTGTDPSGNHSIRSCALLRVG